MEVLDDLLDHDDQLYHQLLCFDFSDEDDDDEDYTESPKRIEKTDSLTQENRGNGESGDTSTNAKESNMDGDNNDEDDEDEDDELFNDDDDHTEASSIADDDEDDDSQSGIDNQRRYRLTRVLKREAADLINDWQKTLLEEQGVVTLPSASGSTSTPAATTSFMPLLTEPYVVCFSQHLYFYL